MEDSETRKNIINYGKSLVEELNLDPGVDTLGRWMAHYIAEQIKIAENSTGIEKAVAEEKCFETIIKLWEHEVILPGKTKPFTDFEPIFRTLNRLDPERNQNYFFDRNDSSKGDSEEFNSLLDLAIEIDKVARIWILHILNKATKISTNEATIKWLEISKGQIEKNKMTVLYEELIWGTDDFTDSETQNDIDRLSFNIKTLEKFEKINQLIMEEYKSEIGRVLKSRD